MKELARPRGTHALNRGVRSGRSFVAVAVDLRQRGLMLAGGNAYHDQGASDTDLVNVSLRRVDDSFVEFEIEAPEVPRDELERERNAELVQLRGVAPLLKCRGRGEGNAVRVGRCQPATVRVVC